MVCKSSILAFSSIWPFAWSTTVSDWSATNNASYEQQGTSFYSIDNGIVTWHIDRVRDMVQSAKMLPAQFTFGYGGDSIASRQQTEDNLGVYDRTNVKMILQVISSGVTEFPHGFYEAVARFPAFCGEFRNVHINLETAEKACKRELAFFWTHFDEDFNTPDKFAEGFCRDDVSYQHAVSPSPSITKNFIAQKWGPMRMRREIQYISFFQAHYNYLLPTSEAKFIEDVQCSAVTAWASALWTYMTPQHLHTRPFYLKYLVSVHEIASGMRNDGDFDSFGASIFLMNNDDKEDEPFKDTICSGEADQLDTLTALQLKFVEKMEWLGLEPEINLECDSASFSLAPFSGMEGYLDSFWWRSYYGPNDQNNCEAFIDGISVEFADQMIFDGCVDNCWFEEWQTTASIFDEEGYKQCICKGGDEDWQPEIADSDVCPAVVPPIMLDYVNFFATAPCACQPIDNYNPCQWYFPSTIEQDIEYQVLAQVGSVYSLVKSIVAESASCRTWADISTAPTDKLLWGIISELEADILPTSFYLLNLIKDNNGMTVNDATFRERYKVETESFLDTASIPADMFMAKTIGQHSLVIIDNLFSDQTRFNFTPPTLPLSSSDVTDMFGDWTFALTPCVDRTKELLGRLDCEHGQQKIKLVVSNICADPEVDLVKYPECGLHVAPRFIDWQSNELSQDPFTLQADSIRTISLPLINYGTRFDGADIKVEMTVNPIDKSWITLYEDRWVIEFKPNSESSEITWLELVLTNSKNNAKSSYTVNIGVTAASPIDVAVAEVNDEIEEEVFTWDWDWIAAEGCGDFDCEDNEDQSRSIDRQKCCIYQDNNEQSKENVDQIDNQGEEDAAEIEDQEETFDDFGDNEDFSDKDPEDQEEEFDGEDDPNQDQEDNDQEGSQDDQNPDCDSKDQECEDLEDKDEDDQDDSEDELERENQENEEKLQEEIEELQNSFDPATLWAAKAELSRLFVQNQEDQDFEIFEEDSQDFELLEDIPVEARIEVPEVSKNGDFKVRFNQPMFLKELFDKFDIGSAKAEESISKNFKDKTDEQRRLQATDATGLSKFLLVYLVRGSPQSSPYSDLGFSIQVVSYDERGFDLKFNFDNPQSVSLGRSPDILVTNVIQPELFISKATGNSLIKQEAQAINVPKQFGSTLERESVDAAKSSIKVAANAAAGSNLALRIFFSVSLKSLWALNHKIQIIVFVANVAAWPESPKMIIQALAEASSGKKMLQPVFDYFEDKTQLGFFGSKQEDDEKQESTASKGISRSLLKNLAIYGVVALLLILVFPLLLIVKLCPGSMKRFCQKIMDIVKKKVFWNAIIRFFIESSLKLSYATIFYLYLFGGFDSNTAVQSSILLLLTLWIGVSAYVPLYYRDELTSPQFDKKFGSFSQGLKLTYATQFLYINFFTLRRYALVICLLVLQDQKYFMILTFLAIYSVQLEYTILVQPMDDRIAHLTEIFNEICFLGLHYLMFFFMSTYIKPVDQWIVGNVASALIVFQFMLNFTLLIRGMLLQTRLNKRLWQLKTKNETIAKREAKKLRKKEKLEKVHDGDINLNLQTVYNICKSQSTSIQSQMIELSVTNTKNIQEEQTPQKEKVTRLHLPSLADQSSIQHEQDVSDTRLIFQEEDQFMRHRLSTRATQIFTFRDRTGSSRRSSKNN